MTGFRRYGVRILIGVILTPVVVAADSRVTITGGADASGHNYAWTVENHHASPIVFVEFPHFHATLFFAPAGWTTESTFLVNVGVKSQPGLCNARADTVELGIAPARSAVFKMQVASTGAQRRPGEVRVRFADGADATVAGVELPSPEPTGDRFVPLIGLGVLFAVWLIHRAIRNSPSKKSATPTFSRKDAK